MITVALWTVSDRACITPANAVAACYAAISIAIPVDRETIERPTNWVRIPIIGSAPLHQAYWGCVIVIIVRPPGVTITAIELTEYFRVTILATTLLTWVENKYSVHSDTNRPINRRCGYFGDRRLKWDLPSVSTLKFLRGWNL